MPTYSMTAPNGRTYEIEGPAGASEADVRAEIMRRNPAAGKAKEAAKPPAMFSALKGMVQGGADIVDLVFSPLRFGASALLDAAGMPEAATAQREGLSGGIDRLMPTPNNQTMVRDVFRGVGGGLGGVGVGKMLANAARQGSVTSRVGKALSASPGGQAIGGAAAGAALNAAQAAGQPVPVQIAAALAAGVIAPGTIDASVMAAGRATAPLRQSYIREQTARILKDNVIGAPDDVARRIDMATTRPAVSGALPTTAEVAGDNALPGFQRSLQSSTKAGGLLTQRMAENALVRQRAADRAMGPGDVTRLGDEAGAAADHNAWMLAARRKAVGPFEPAEVSGQAARGLLDERAAAAKAQASARYNIAGGEEPVQVGAFEPDIPQGMGDATGLRSFQDQAAAAMRPAAAPKTDTVFSYLRPRSVAMPDGKLRVFGGVRVGSELDRELRALGYGPKQLPGVFRTNGGMNTTDDLDMTLVQAGFAAGEGGRLGKTEVLNLIADDIAAMGKSAGRSGSRPVPVDDALGQSAAKEARANSADWERRFDEAGFDPERMQADDWDNFYRQSEGLPPREVTADDAAFLAQRADDAERRIPLSPFQASLVALQRNYFPAGLPANSGVNKLIQDLTRADVLETKQVEVIIRDLRAQSRRLKLNDGVSAGLAKSAANAAEGFLSSQAGPARMQAMAAARKGWRDYSSTFREGEPGRALAANQFGTPRLDAGQVPAALVPAGRTGAAAAARLQKAVGFEQAEGVARAEMRRALESAGNDAGRIAAVADRYADTLRAYPALAGNVTAARETAALADAFTGSPLARVGAAGDPVAAVSQLVRAQDGGRNLRQLIQQMDESPMAAAGLRRALAGHIEAASLTRAGVNADGAATINNNGLRTAIDDVVRKTAMTRLLSRDQRRVLLNIRREAKGQQFANTANRTPGSDTARNAETWTRFAAVVMNGVGGPKMGAVKTVLDFAIAVAGRADAVRQLSVEAMLDPKLAADLLRTPTPDRVKSLAKRMGGYTAGSAIAIYSADRM